MFKYLLPWIVGGVVLGLGAGLLFSSFVHANPAPYSDPRVVDPDIAMPPWKLRVVIAAPDKPETVMTLTDGDHTPRLWGSKDECAAFLTSDEFKTALVALAKRLIEQGYDETTTELQFACVSAPPPGQPI